MYRAIGLLQPGSDYSLDAALGRLRARLPSHTITHAGQTLTIAQGEWEMYMTVVSGPEIRTENAGILSHLAGIEQTEAETFTSTDRRVEVWSDTPDPFMEHFDDYLGVVEVLKSFTGLLAVDPKEPGVL